VTGGVGAIAPATLYATAGLRTPANCPRAGSCLPRRRTVRWMRGRF